MNLLADENIDQPIVDRLRQEGYDVVYIAELAPSIDDDDVMSEANIRSAVLLTGDKDFGELVFRQQLMHAGVVLCRLGGLSAALKADLVAQAFRGHAAEFIGAFSVISPGIVRIRRPSP